ncbi:MAG TPA: efflux RND transporter periplasmic adaptor subunit [Thermoanaerobaculia bacterium]|nr:efflux RND transporter periplasmic adaptor subunit [Thermoanaerobaculia bacterium]
MMGNRAALALFCLLCPSLLAGCLGGARAEGEGDELVVRRGTFRERVLLTGELEAERGDALVVPRTDSFQLQIRWIAEDGVGVKAGDRVVEFDNSSFASSIEEKRLSESDAASQLDRTAADARTSLAEKEFTVEQRRADVEKARIQAGVSKDLLPLAEYQDRQLALRRAEMELAKAVDDLASYRKASASEIAVQRITLDKSRREIRIAQEAISALTLRAPRDGMVLAAQHPWEGRKIQEGDSVWTGMTVATLPDLSSMVVEASLSDVDDGRIAPGMRVVCVLDAYPSRVFPGRVVEITPVARDAARSPLLRYFPVRIALDKPDPARMRPGMSVRVEVMGPEIKDAVLAPRAGLDLTAEPPQALLAGGGTAPVRIRSCSASECVVSGVEPGTRLRSREGRAG